MDNGNIYFNQELFFDYANNTKNRDYFVKMTTESGINYASSAGYCYGLVNEYLLYMVNNQGEEYIKQLNSLYDMANSYDDGLTPPERIRNKALRKHARVLLNEMLNDIIKIQSTYHKSVINYNYFKNFEYPKINNKKFIDYIGGTIEENLYRCKKIYGENSIHYTYLYESQKLKLKKYAEALFANEAFFETAEGKIIFTDPLYIKLREKYKTRLPSLEKTYTIDDAKFFIGILNEDIQRDNYLNLGAHNNRKGASDKTESHNYAEHLLSYDTLGNLKEILISRTQTTHEPIFLKFCSPKHAMAITAIYDENNQSWGYTFFDPNVGVTKFKSQDDFINYIDFYVKMNAKTYGFRLLKNNDYEIKTFEFKKDENFKGDKPLKKLNANNIRITENTILVDNKLSVTDKINDIEMTYKGFSQDHSVVEIKVTIDKKIFYVYSNILDVSDLQNKIKSNRRTLLSLKSNCFISDYEYNVYSLSKNVNMKMFHTESIGTVLEREGKLFEKALLDSDFENIYSMQNHYNMNLAGEQSKSIRNIASWHDPLAIYREWQSLYHEPASIVTAGEYDYNVII